VIETPFVISPNRVIEATSLLAAVLAAVMSAGALGAMWSSGGAAAGRGVAAPSDGAAPLAVGQQPVSGGAGGSSGPGPAGPSGPGGPSTPSAPSAPGEIAARVPQSTNAFTRPDVGPTGGGGGGS
jgi:hypothetical protein